MIGGAKWHRRLSTCLLLLCLMFIWGNSMLPAAWSEAFSHWVGAILQALFPGDGVQGEGHGLLRKAAHFGEFCGLGLALCWHLGMWLHTHGAWIAGGLLGGFFTACVDETIQHFSPGRNPSFWDVAIDTAGTAVGIALFLGGVALIKKKKHYSYNGGKQ